HTEEFRSVCERLGIAGNSWIFEEVLFSAARAAIEAGDRQFVDSIKALLLAISDQRFAAARDRILAQLLDRYGMIRAAAVHTELRDFAVASWKNPWLASNDAAWSSVLPATKNMVAGWLKLDLIREFFEVLSGERGSDSNRFHFWKQYHEQI